jgi:hypothetical protein
MKADWDAALSASRLLDRRRIVLLIGDRRSRWKAPFSGVVVVSGVVVGLNNKAKVTMRRSYACRTHRVLELALDHSPGKLPERESTHDFF